jgi:hypothetical protein
MSRLVVAEIVAAAESLTGLELSDAVAFPEETLELGFDHLDGTSPVTTDLVDALDRFATATSDAWAERLRGETAVTSEVWRWGEATGCAMEDTWGGDGYWWLLFSQHPATQTLTVPATGDWLLTLGYFHRIALDGDDGLDVQITVDGAEVWRETVLGPTAPSLLEIPVTLDAGDHEVAITVLDGLTDDQLVTTGNPRCITAEAIGLRDLSLVGPRQATPLGGGCFDDACLDDAITTLATRAWRRPPTTEERDRLTTMVRDSRAAGDHGDDALALALRAVLSSPHFLYLPEPQAPEPTPLAGWQVATRLARTLWGSLPDEALLACADDLLAFDDPTCGLRAQTDRLLADPRAERFQERFLTAWLGLRSLDTVERDPAAYPHFLDARPFLLSESVAVFDELLGDRTVPATDLVRAPFTWLSPELARHYELNIPGIDGWYRVALSDRDSRGLLAHAGVLTATSPHDRTSPVLRGTWVLTRMLCEEPGSPPDDVPPLELAAGEDPLEALEAHLAQPACASCHRRIDPMGLPFEGFDHAGQRRTTPPPVTETVDGVALTGLGDLADLLAEDPTHARCLARTLATWSLTHAVEMSDTAHLDDWLATAEAEGGSWRALLDAILTSPSFTHRQELP